MTATSGNINHCPHFSTVLLLSEHTGVVAWLSAERESVTSNEMEKHWAHLLFISHGCSDLHWSTLRSLKHCYPKLFLMRLSSPQWRRWQCRPARSLDQAGSVCSAGECNKQWHCLVRAGRIKGINITRFSFFVLPQ